MSWLAPTANDRRLATEFERGSETAARLARLLAPALRIEPNLLRNARHRFLPQTHAGLESELWFSPLAHSRNARAVSFQPGVARLLTDALDAGGEPGLVEATEFIESQTAHWPREIRLEQRLRLAARRADVPTLRAGLREVLRWFQQAAADAERTEILRWARAAVPKLMLPEWQIEEARWLMHLAAAALGDASGDLARLSAGGEGLPDWLASRTAESAPGLLGLNVRPGQLEFVPPGKGAHDLPLGPAVPALLGLIDRAGAATRWERVWAGQVLEIPPTTERITLVTITGRQFALSIESAPESNPPGEAGTHPLPRRIRLVHLLDESKEAFELADRLQALGLSVDLVADRVGGRIEREEPGDGEPPTLPTIRLWTRRSARRYEKMHSSPPKFPGIVARLDDVPLPKGTQQVATVDLFDENQRFSESGLQRLAGQLRAGMPEMTVWLAYPYDGRELAETLCETLAARSIHCLDENTLKPSKDLASLAGAAISRSEVVLVLHTEMMDSDDYRLGKLEIARRFRASILHIAAEVHPDLEVMPGEHVLTLDEAHRLTPDGLRAMIGGDGEAPSPGENLATKGDDWYIAQPSVPEDVPGEFPADDKVPGSSPHPSGQPSRQIEALLNRLDDPSTPPAERLAIGDELARLGDPRPGVGLGDRGLPSIDWVPVPAGPFLFGKDKQRRELPAFEIARYPVTNAQYQAFVGAGGYPEDRWWLGLGERIEQPPQSRWSKPNRPRESVSWYEAVAFCRWLSAELGQEIRLPNEYEWEKAARGPDGREYPWGEGYREGFANVDEKVYKDGLSHPQETSAVGIYPQGASPYGALDMAGNVWEWCLNRFNVNPYNDPDSSDLSGEAVRALRGGSSVGGPSRARAAARLRSFPGSWGVDMGFRVLRVSPI